MREVSESVFDYDFHVLAEISVDVHSQERTVQNHMPESVFEIILTQLWDWFGTISAPFGNGFGNIC